MSPPFSACLPAEEAIAVLAKSLPLFNADFSKLAEKFSHDTRTANKGGDLGWLIPDYLTEDFDNQMRKLRNNEVSEPFMTEDGWAIIQVVDRRSMKNSDDAARNHALQILTMRKTNEAIEAWTKRI